MNPEAVATEVATNLDALGALMSSRDNSHSSGHVTVSPVPTNDAAIVRRGGCGNPMQSRKTEGTARLYCYAAWV